LAFLDRDFIPTKYDKSLDGVSQSLNNGGDGLTSPGASRNERLPSSNSLILSLLVLEENAIEGLSSRLSGDQARDIELCYGKLMDKTDIATWIGRLTH